MSWTIKGEAGKTMDATARSLETLRIDSCLLTFSSLAPDTLVWTARTDNATGTGTIVPEAGQVVELWNGSTRKFKGWATAPRIGVNSVEITIEGPWWWMSRIMLTQDQADGTAAVAERTSYHFSTGNLATSMAALIDRAIANGCPFARGTIATMYDICAVTLANMDCGSALAEFMRWVPDAVARFDYTATDSSTVPTLNILRRKSGLAAGSMSAVSYAVGTEAVEYISIAPRLDLEVSQSKLAYVTRQAVTGKPQWASQESGTFAAGKRQMLTISGPEILDYLPPDAFETADTWTADAMFNNFAISYVPQLQAIYKQYGSCLGGINYQVQHWTGTIQFPASHIHGFPTLAYDQSVSGYYLVSSGEGALKMPDWLIKQLGAKRVKCTGTWIAYEAYSGAGWSNQFTAHTAGATVLDGYVDQAMTQRYYHAALLFAFNCLWIPLRVPTRTTFYKTADFSYAYPPAGLAANLLACQNFVPYEGSVTIVADAVTGDNTVGNVLNLTNSLPAHATMAAMVRNVAHDLIRGRTTWNLGTPARSDFGSLVARIRRDPKDSIIVT